MRRERRMKIDRSHAAHGAHHLVHHAPGLIKKSHFHAPRCMGHPLAIKGLPRPRGDQCTPRCCERTRTAGTGLLRDGTCHFCPPSVFRQPPFLASDVQRCQPIRAGPRFRQFIQAPCMDLVQIKQVQFNGSIRPRSAANVAAQINRRRHHGESKIILMLAKQANPARR